MLNKLALLSAGLLSGLTIGISITQANAQETKPGYTVRDFPNLQKGLLETPGCLGVETAQVGKKGVIFAWFENRKSMEAWYYSKMHTDAMKKFFPNQAGGKPFPLFTDEKSPMLVVASVTPSDKPAPGAGNLAVSQIAIEAYAPISGGVALGSTFAPEKMKNPGLVKLGQ